MASLDYTKTIAVIEKAGCRVIFADITWPRTILDYWVVEIERFPITTQTSLVGHSMGGGFWVRYLSEHPELFVDTVVLVAPWVNINHEVTTDFFDFELNPTITEQANRFIIFASDDDGDEVQNSVNYLVDMLPNAEVKTFHGYGHFTRRVLKDNTFPELLTVLKED